MPRGGLWGSDASWEPWSYKLIPLMDSDLNWLLEGGRLWEACHWEREFEGYILVLDTYVTVLCLRTTMGWTVFSSTCSWGHDGVHLLKPTGMEPTQQERELWAKTSPLFRAVHIRYSVFMCENEHTCAGILWIKTSVLLFIIHTSAMTNCQRNGRKGSILAHCFRDFNSPLLVLMI